MHPATLNEKGMYLHSLEVYQIVEKTSFDGRQIVDSVEHAT